MRIDVTVEVLAKGNCTACRQQEINATILPLDTTHYLFTPWSSALPEKLPGSQVDKKFPAFYGTQRFIIAFKSRYHEPTRSSPCPTSVFLKIHLNIFLPLKPVPSKRSLSLKFPHQNPVYTSPLPTRATCPAHFIFSI
jgi:hypothetical protein